MPEIYRAGEAIPELGGAVRGGATVVMHEPGEVDACRTLVTLGGPAFRTFFRSLTSQAKDWSAWTSWITANDRLPASEIARFNASESGLPEWAALDLVLTAAKRIWRNQGDRTQEVAVMMSVSDLDPSSGGELELSGQHPALVFHQGSIKVSLILGGLRAAGFSVAFLQSRGLARSRRAANLTEALRTDAERGGQAISLHRLDKLPKDRLAGARAVIICLHGFLSTDVGLFDSLIRRVRDAFARDGSEVVFVGWPHDTLTGIEANAIELARDIRRAIGLTVPIAFVAHSRGGLVARATAVRLYDRTGENWRRRLRGCVTFGTPHNGAGLSELPEVCFGILVAGQALHGTGSWASLSDALWYCSRRESIEGIQDLRPLAAGGTFLKRLIDAEEAQAPPGYERILRLLAIGGQVVPHGNWWTVLAGHAFGDDEHDLVIETSSTMPKDAWRRIRVNCDHFSYFNESLEAKPHFEEAAAFLRDSLGFPRGQLGTASGHRSSDLPVEFDDDEDRA